MGEDQKVPALARGDSAILGRLNYPPFLNLMRFVPGEVPEDRRFIIMSLFFIHLGCLLACILNFIDNCIEGGLGILYSLLFMFIFNPLALLLFYRAHSGLTSQKENLKMYLILQPIAVILLLIGSIVNFLGFNGFVRVHQKFSQGHGVAGALGVVVALLFLGLSLYSGFIYGLIIRRKKDLTSSLL